VLLLAEGTALINGEDIKIAAHDDSSKVIEELLSGKVLSVASDSATKSAVFKGIVYFTAGSKLSFLEPNCSGESVELKDGSKVIGHITELTKETCTIEPISSSTKQLAMDSIREIHSPKVFKFAINAEPQEIMFEPTCKPSIAVDAKKGFSKKRAIIVGAVVVTMATGIACGVAIPLAVHHHHHQLQNPGQLISLVRTPPVTRVVVPGTHVTVPSTVLVPGVFKVRPIVPALPRAPRGTTATPAAPATPILGTSGNYATVVLVSPNGQNTPVTLLLPSHIFQSILFPSENPINIR
jgi:hypothetical protein